MHILIVDDSASERLLLSAMLRGAGFAEVSTAASAEEALGRLASSGVTASIDLVLMDINMEHIDGIAACRALKALPSARTIPVIMVTGSSQTDDLEAAFAAGAHDYITKPPRKTDLLARVGAALRLKRETDERIARERQLLDYVEQVGHVTDAAAAVERDAFDPASLESVATRPDALGGLARVFQRMAVEVRAREERLQQQVRELRIEIDVSRQARTVAEITESEHYQNLRRQAAALRKILGSS
jgi:two-component system cell cycle response regulator